MTTKRREQSMKFDSSSPLLNDHNKIYMYKSTHTHANTHTPYDMEMIFGWDANVCVLMCSPEFKRDGNGNNNNRTMKANENRID